MPQLPLLLHAQMATLAWRGGHHQDNSRSGQTEEVGRDRQGHAKAGRCRRSTGVEQRRRELPHHLRQGGIADGRILCPAAGRTGRDLKERAEYGTEGRTSYSHTDRLTYTNILELVHV